MNTVLKMSGIVSDQYMNTVLNMFKSNDAFCPFTKWLYKSRQPRPDLLHASRLQKEDLKGLPNTL